jgi:hypothetical protein
LIITQAHESPRPHADQRMVMGKNPQAGVCGIGAAIRPKDCLISQ